MVESVVILYLLYSINVTDSSSSCARLLSFDLLPGPTTDVQLACDLWIQRVMPFALCFNNKNGMNYIMT